MALRFGEAASYILSRHDAGRKDILMSKSINVEVSENDWSEFLAQKARRLKLTKCEGCGGYRGAATVDRQISAVNCLCDGITCRKCHANRTYRPISNYFSLQDGNITHVPYFKSMCLRCTQRHNRSVLQPAAGA
jgi:hypothetical protein